MSRKTLLTVLTSVMLGAAVTAADPSLAQLPPPPLGGLPGLPGGAPTGLRGDGPAGLPSPGGPGPRAADFPRSSGIGAGRARLHGGQGDIIDRSGTHAYGHGGFYGRTSNYGYGRSAHGYGDRSWRRRDWARYGDYEVPSNSDSSSCYYADKYSSQLGAYTQVQVCSED
jgi:hypothetical protein